MTTLALSSALLKVRRASRRDPELRRNLVVSPRQAILGFRGLEPDESAALLSLHRDDIAALTQQPTRRPFGQPFNPTGAVASTGPRGELPSVSCSGIYTPGPTTEIARPRLVASATNHDGRLEVFYVTVAGALYHKWELAPGGAPGAQPQPNQPPPPVWSDAAPFVAMSGIERVAVVSDYYHLLQVFFVDEGNLYVVAQRTTDFTLPADQIWGSPVLLVSDRANPVEDLVVAVDGTGRVNVFYVGGGAAVYLLRQKSPDLGWPASGARLTATTTTDMAVGTNCDGRLELFFVDGAGGLEHTWELAPGGTWSKPALLARNAARLAVGRNADRSLAVFYIYADSGTVMTVRQVASAAAKGANINCGLDTWTVPALFGEFGDAKLIEAFTNWDGRLELVITDTSDMPWHTWQDASNSWSGQSEQFGWSAASLAGGLNSDGRLEIFYARGDGFMFHNWQLQPGLFWAGEYPFPDVEQTVVWAEEKFLILGPRQQPSVAPDGTPITWSVNDHCFAPLDSGTWHMFGIVAPNPTAPCVPPPKLLVGMGQAISSQPISQGAWRYTNDAFADPPGGVLWAPHVRRTPDKMYWMVYCTGGSDLTAFGISRRTSSDLATWGRLTPLFSDGYQARDPMLLWLPQEQTWVIYYCATDFPEGGHHVVKYRVSTSGDPNNLDHWSEPAVAYTDYHVGDQYGPTESPFVVYRAPYYYLFIGPRPYDKPCCDPSCSDQVANFEHPGYIGTDVFRSTRWDCWTNADYVGHIPAHAAEVFCVNGQWFASSAGIEQGGLYLMRLHWEDGLSGCSPEW